MKNMHLLYILFIHSHWHVRMSRFTIFHLWLCAASCHWWLIQTPSLGVYISQMPTRDCCGGLRIQSFQEQKILCSDFFNCPLEKPKIQLFFEACFKAIRRNVQIEFCKQCLQVKLRVKYPIIFYNYTPE